jgi:hypothetical protein
VILFRNDDDLKNENICMVSSLATTSSLFSRLPPKRADNYIENSKSIISDGTPEAARSAMDILYTTLESGATHLSVHALSD